MLKQMSVIISIFIFLFSFSGMAQDKKHEYIGVKKCITCHKSEKQGKQKDIWSKSKHSQSYTVLASEEAMEKAKKLGVKDPQNSKECLTCHAPQFDKKELLQAKFKLEEGVQCESCHGAGSAYKKKKIMKDRDKAIANGLIIPDEKTCLNCHKADNPEHKKEFNFEESWEKIKHPIPEKKKS